MNTLNVKTPSYWEDKDLSISPTAYTNSLSIANISIQPRTLSGGTVIPAIAFAAGLISMSSQALALPPDASGFETVAFTNRGINYTTLDESLLDTEDDPALLAFLDYLDQQMAVYPELIVEADYAQLQRIAKLVEGVELEDDD